MHERFPALVFVGLLYFFSASAFLSAASPAKSRAQASFLVVYSNDRHGYIQPAFDPVMARDVGGVDCECTLLGRIRRAARREGVPLLCVDAGDIFQGTPVVNETRGECMIRILNHLRYHMITFGNHEFDYGLDVLLERMKESRFIWVSSNVDAPVLAEHYVPYVTYDLAGTRIAFLAVTTTTTPSITYPENVRGITFQKPLDALEPMVARLKKEHDVKIFILLSHLGLERDEWLAGRLPVFTLIIGGHSHSRIDEAIRIGKTTIVQAACNGRYVGLARVCVDPGGMPVSVSSELREIDRALYDPDPGLASLLRFYTDELDLKLSSVVGNCSATLEKGFSGLDSPLGVIFADAYRECAGTEIGLMNLGGVRRSIEKGPVTMRDILLASPFNNTVVKMSLSGRMIGLIFERSLSGNWQEIPEDKKRAWHESGRGSIAGYVPTKRKIGFLVGAGVQYSFDSTRPPGQRLQSLRLLGEAMVPDRMYTVAMNSFLAFGGDGFKEFTLGSAIEDTGVLDSEALKRYFRSRTIVSPPAEPSAVNLSLKTSSTVVAKGSGE